MSSVSRAVLPLRGLLALLFAALVLAQVLMLGSALPGLVAPPPQDPAGLVVMRWMLLAAVVLGLLCVEAVIVCTWKLLTLVDRDRIFSSDALPWVDAIVRILAAACVVVVVGAVPVLYFAQVDDAPGLAGVPLLVLAATAAVGLLMIVMRALLRRAAALHSDMEAVI
jgi:hypothetical protein